LIEASETREQFSQGRIAMEEAKILDKAGDHSASSEKYESAALIFQNLLRSNPKQIGNEVAMLFYLCQAWQKMTMAEARVSPSMYGEAADLFKLANEHSSNESASLLALANSNFCKALQAGTEFEVARNMAMYREAGKYMDAAANYYLKAGLRTSSEYAKATQRLFDAHVFMGSGKRESDPEQGAKYYLMAEKVLQLSAESYTKAKHLQKANQVYRLLCKVKEEKELALSLGDILHAPTITSPTSGFATLSLSEEKAVGLERFARADIQVKLVQHENKIKVGQDVDLEIQIVNVGKEPILLTKIEDIAPVGFQMVDKPDYCSVESTNLIFKGKQLHPLETDEMKIVLRPFMKGSFKIKPRITCVDELGRALFCSPEALTFDVLAVLLAGRITTGYSDLDNLLFGGIPENCSVLLISPSSDERELLITKFLEAGARSGQITFYITTDMRGVKAFAEYCQLNFFLFVFVPRADAFVESSPNVFRLNGVENLTDIDICLTKVLHRLEPEHNGPRRACIKILSDVLLQHHAVVTQKWLSGFLPELRSKGFTTIAVVNPKMHPTEEVQAIVDQFEGEIEIYEKQTEKGIGQFLRIRKLIGQHYLKNELLLPKE
jgi:KaiC/GvpD/RAD55 family RecA-like ATPase/tetratricopeptide (TPR) repeat protein